MVLTYVSVPFGFKPLKGKLTSSLPVRTDIAIQGIFADGDIKLPLQSPADNLR
jgi:hypothetical protein